MNKIFTASLLVFVAACTTAPEYKKPEVALPDSWSAVPEVKNGQNENTQPQPENSFVGPVLPIGHESDKSTSHIADKWWNDFNDKTLTSLIETGLINNSDLLKAASAVSISRSALTVTNADLLPQIGVQAGANRAKLGNVNPANTFSLSAVLNYEIDLWGKLRDASTSARATLLATENNRDAIKLAIASDIAAGYFNICALEAQIKVTENTIKSRRDSYKYHENQYNYGAAEKLTLKQSEAELAQAEATEPELKQLLLEQQTALAVLLGQSPKQVVEANYTCGENIASMPVPPELPKILPSEILQRRPDIAASEQNLIAANADIGVARADYFPSLSLSALLGLQSGNIDNLLQSSSRAWQIGGAAAAPIFNAGKTSAGVDIAKANKEIAVTDYQNTIRIAFKEVTDAMNAEANSRLRIKAQNKQVAALTEALRISDMRYKSGYSSYLEVLDSERNLHQSQLNLITAKRDRLIAVINLYKSMGGGWQAKN